MANIEDYLQKAKEAMDKSSTSHAVFERGYDRMGQDAIYRALESLYYQNQAIIELLREKRTDR